MKTVLRGAVVIQCAKKTGDYSVLSHADLSVLALTYALDVKEKELAKVAGEGAEVLRPRSVFNCAPAYRLS